MALGTVAVVAEDWQASSSIHLVGKELQREYPRMVSVLLNKESLGITAQQVADEQHMLGVTIQRILQETAEAPPPLVTTRGTYEVPVCVNANHDRTQAYFNAGMRLILGFDYVRAAPYFRHAAALDPDCAMCLWGHMLCLGQTLNMPPLRPFMLRAHQIAKKALQLVDTPGTPIQAPGCERDRHLVRALAKRYPADPTHEAVRAASEAYAEAMLEATKTLRSDVTTLVVAADSVMNLSPWDYWETPSAFRPKVADASPLLTAALAIDPDHPTALHLKIHLFEASPTRLLEAAPQADRLDAVAFHGSSGSSTGGGSGSSSSMADLPHLLHMASHIYMHTGDYSKCVRENAAAWAAPLEASVYPMHNAESMIWCARMAGKKAEALQVAAGLEARARTWKLSRHVEAGSGTERWIVQRLLTLVYFEEYDAIEAEEDNVPMDEMPYARSVWLMAKGTAAAFHGRVAEAEGSLGELTSERLADSIKALKDAHELGPYLSGVAEAGLYASWLKAAILFARGDPKAAASELIKAAEREEGLMYDEPVTFFAPLRHEAGSMLLAAGDEAAARGEFAASLARFPASGVSLYGLALACEALADAKCANDNHAKAKAAWASADADGSVSLFRVRNMRKPDVRRGAVANYREIAQMQSEARAMRGLGALGVLLVAVIVHSVLALVRSWSGRRASDHPEQGEVEHAAGGAAVRMRVGEDRMGML